MTIRAPLVLGDDGIAQQLQASDSLLAPGTPFYVSGAYAQAGPSSATRTSILPAATATTSLTVKANTFGVGDVLILEGIGYVTTPAVTAGTLTLTTSLGGTDIDTTTFTPANGMAGPFAFRIAILQRGTAASPTALASGTFTYSNQAAAASMAGLQAAASPALVAVPATTTDRLLGLAATFANSNASNALYIHHALASIRKAS